MPELTCCPERFEWKLFRHEVLQADRRRDLEEHQDCHRCRQQLAAVESEADGPAPPRPLAALPTGQGRALGAADAFHELRPTHNLKGYQAAADAPPGVTRIGHYRVLEVLGQGGMGTVFKAFDEVLHRLVAIKGMALQLMDDPVAYQRFLREAKAAAAIRNEHVVTLHAVIEAEGMPFLVMEYVEGVSLQQRLESEGPLPLEEVVRIGAEAAWGLAAAHAKGIIHRDVKPANILLEGGHGRVKITDFGLARPAGADGLTRSGEVAGTPQYMAPEQAWGKLMDARSDLFSLGGVLYAMCTGRAPFDASETMAVLRMVCEEDPPDPAELNPEVPGWLAGLIARLQAKCPEDRFQSAAEVAELLQNQWTTLQRGSTPSRTFSPWRSARRLFARGWRAARKAKIVLVILVTMIVTVAGFMIICPPPQVPPGFQGPIPPGFRGHGPAWRRPFFPPGQHPNQPPPPQGFDQGPPPEGQGF